MEITHEILKNLPYRLFVKKACIQARPLTKEDYIQRQGIVQSLEGPVKFQPGHYLARGVLDEEWPMSEEGLIDTYEQIEGPDEEGFLTYRPKPIIRQVYQMSEPFIVTRPNGIILHGKPGDYLIWLGDRARIVDQTVFEKSYELVSE